MDKASLRRRLLKEREGLSPAERARSSAAIVRHLKAWLDGRSVDLVCLYHAMRGEPDVLSLASELPHLAFALPVVGEVKGVMSFHAYRPGDPLVKSPLGMLEPDPVRSNRVVPSARTVVVVPAVGLDAKGGRLGYGGGYYDRFLKSFQGTAIGVVFQSMMVDAIPTQSHDHQLPFRVTEQGVFPRE
jgi:5-formyltetrahydrofolate cyclo-ligase